MLYSTQGDHNLHRNSVIFAVPLKFIFQEVTNRLKEVMPAQCQRKIAAVCMQIVRVELMLLMSVINSFLATKS